MVHHCEIPLTVLVYAERHPCQGWSFSLQQIARQCLTVDLYTSPPLNRSHIIHFKAQVLERYGFCDSVRRVRQVRTRQASFETAEDTIFVL